MLNLLDGALSTVSNVMHWVLISTIILGCLILIVFLVLITKRIIYNRQMKENKQQRKKIIKNEPLEDEETP